MKEINEKTVSRARFTVVILGIVRGILYLLCSALTFVYSYFMLNAMNTNSGRGWFGGGWMFNALLNLYTDEDVRMGYDFSRIDFDRIEKLMELFEKLENRLGPNWPTNLYFATVAIVLAVCVVLYFWARRKRVFIAGTEKE